MRAARGADSGNSYGGYNKEGGNSYQPPVEYDDRMMCPHCGRKFNESAG